MAVLSPERVRVSAENDVVVLQVGRAQARFSYNTAAMIAQGMRLAANQAAMVGKARPDERQAMRAALPLGTHEAMLNAKASEERRATNTATASMRWSTGVMGELVTFDLGNVHMEFEPETAYQISHWLRIQARVAKLWSGDTGRTMRVSGTLTDAEQNYRHGLR